jgi:hypothetical protein
MQIVLIPKLRIGNPDGLKIAVQVLQVTGLLYFLDLAVHQGDGCKCPVDNCFMRRQADPGIRRDFSRISAYRARKGRRTRSGI